MTSLTSPPVARITASVVPSPPSATGITLISASSRLYAVPLAMIEPASSLLMLPLKLSAATMIFMPAIPPSEPEDRGQP